MKITSLALASTLAAVVFSAQPVLAQNQIVPGPSNPSSSENGGGMRNGGAVTGGQNQSDERDGSWRGRRSQDSAGARPGGMGWRHGGRLSQDQGRELRRRMMERHREMMGMGGPRIRLSRGNARIDVQCGPNDSMKVCADAAAELLEKVAGMRGRAQQQGATSGSAVTPPTSGSGESGQAPDTNNEDEEQNLDSNPTPNSSGERM